MHFSTEIDISVQNPVTFLQICGIQTQGRVLLVLRPTLVEKFHGQKLVTGFFDCHSLLGLEFWCQDLALLGRIQYL